jgi:hypothetical protein
MPMRYADGVLFCAWEDMPGGETPCDRIVVVEEQSPEESDRLRPGIVGLMEWQRAIRDDPGLRSYMQAAKGNRPHGWDVRYIALTIASHGQNGRGCFATAATIAAEVGCSRNTVETARQYLINAGWFSVLSRTGGANRRSLVLSIALPP